MEREEFQTKLDRWRIDTYLFSSDRAVKNHRLFAELSKNKEIIPYLKDTLRNDPSWQLIFLIKALIPEIRHNPESTGYFRKIQSDYLEWMNKN